MLLFTNSISFPRLHCHTAAIALFCRAVALISPVSKEVGGASYIVKVLSTFGNNLHYIFLHRSLHCML